MANGIGGSALYNLLVSANNENFNATKFDASGSSIVNSSGKISNNTTNIKDLSGNNFGSFLGAGAGGAFASFAGISPAVQQAMLANQNKVVKGNTQYQYDIFDRLQFNTPPNSVVSGIENTTYTPASRNSKVDNRVVINYKNYVEYEKLNPNDTSDRTFYNKIRTNSYFTAQDFKDPSIDTIVKNLSTYPTTKISYSDFVYCKKLGAYPNNRLVILRRFFQPVDDNLFDSPYANNQQNPLSVMVTWFDDFPFEIRYGEKWEEFANGIVEEFSNTISSLTPDKLKNRDFVKGFTDTFSKMTKSSDGSRNITSPWLKTLWYQFIDDLYKSQSPNLPPNFKNILTEANPNLIQRSVIKKGLSFSVSIELSFTYVMRYINGIDPHVAMHNIYANAIRMGSSSSVTIFPKATKSLPDFMKNLNEGKIVQALEGVFNNVSDYLKKLYNRAEEAAKNISVRELREKPLQATLDATLSAVNSDYSQRLFSLFRFQLMAAIQADLGTPSGVWHVTIGNPFNPIVTMGDLVIRSGDGMTMKFNNELSYNDQPTEVTFTISLENARPRGAQEIEQIFNAGRGRIYVYPLYEDDPDLYLSDTNPTMGSVKSEQPTNPTQIKPN